MTAYKKKRKTRTTNITISPETPDQAAEVLEIQTQDNLYGYVVATTTHGAQASCLHCPWTCSTEGGTIRGAFNAAEKRARQHTTAAHPEKSRNVYTAALCTCGHTKEAHPPAINMPPPQTIAPCNQPACPCREFVPAPIPSTRKEEPTP